LLTRSDQIPSHIRGPRVLDVGCAGHLAKQNSPYWLHGKLREKFEDVVGIDIDEENVKELNALGYKNIFLASAETFTLPNKFDTIVAGDLIEHLKNPGSFLERAKEHLAEGGRVVITTPYPFSFLFTVYSMIKFPKTCSSPEHTCWFCPRTFEVLIQRCGFRVLYWDLIDDYRADYLLCGIAFSIG